MDDTAATVQNEQQLVDHIAGSTDGLHLETEMRNRYSEDPFFSEIIQKPKHFKNFEVADGLVFLHDNNQQLLCIPHVIIRGRNVREVVISHAHSLLAHLGGRKTVDLLRNHIWWKTLVVELPDYQLCSDRSCVHLFMVI